MAGNANSGKRQQPFLEALLMEIKIAGKDHRQLRSIAKSLLKKAEDGDMQAIIALADRLDGRPRQAVEATLDGQLTVQIIRMAAESNTKGLSNG